jgi:hypothetical protein
LNLYKTLAKKLHYSSIPRNRNEACILIAERSAS